MKPTQKSKPDYAVYVVEGEGDKAALDESRRGMDT